MNTEINMKNRCMRCEQYRVISRRQQVFIGGAGLLLAGAIVTIFVFFIGIPVMICGIIGMIASPFVKGTYCENCKQVIK